MTPTPEWEEALESGGLVVQLAHHLTLKHRGKFPVVTISNGLVGTVLVGTEVFDDLCKEGKRDTAT
jgi:hypothetical protein